MRESLQQQFQTIFATPPALYRAPGRVNLIGEHTDYNDGFVMPAAIGFYTHAAIAPRTDRKLIVHSLNYAEQIALDLENLPNARTQHWSDYIIGVAKILSQAGIPLRGANLLLHGDVPQGAGLSSSASVEVATAYALQDLSQIEIDRMQLARWCQQAENEFVGARCGIMDQFIASHGKQNHALLLDCRSLEFRALPLPADVQLVICNTLVKHSIADGKYNERRAECEAGVKMLALDFAPLQSLRDVKNIAALETLPETLRRRCQHVISENERTLQAASALEQNDLAIFGNLMYESHASLRDDYEVSCDELDFLVEIARTCDGVYGARMTGGGFGGCTINLVKTDFVAAFKAKIAVAYEQKFQRQPEIFVCTAAEGAGKIS